MDDGPFPFQPGWEEQEVARSKRRRPESVQAARMQKVGRFCAQQPWNLPGLLTRCACGAAENEGPAGQPGHGRAVVGRDPGSPHLSTNRRGVSQPAGLHQENTA